MENQKKLIELRIIFENCELFSLSPKQIINLNFSKLYHDYAINGFQYTNGEILDFITAEGIYLIINKDALTEICPISEITLEERIKMSDINCFELIYDDDSKNLFYSTWNYENDTFNSYQHNLFTKNNDLAIIIKENITKQDLDLID